MLLPQNRYYILEQYHLSKDNPTFVFIGDQNYANILELPL